MKIVAYYRVSTKKQGHSGLGMAAQKTDVLRYSELNTDEIVASYIEVESGKNCARPELSKALAHARSANATLVVAKLDRLSRNMAFIASIMEAGVDFVACDNPTASKFNLHILAALAENETVQVSRRTKDALAACTARGVKLGSARPGHWEGREHLRGFAKATAVSATVRKKRISDLYSFILPIISEMRERNASYEEIADKLNAEGHQTSAGRPLDRRSVWRIFTSAQKRKVAV